MVFKSFTHLARPSFSKALNHGYAQSVVAATQSSYASSTAPYPRSSRVSRPHTSQLHTAFHNASGQPGYSTKASLGTPDAPERKDVDPNLLGYYEALWKCQQSGEDTKEWTQFQFTKRIEWNPPSVVPSARGQEQADLGLSQDSSQNRASLDRAYSANAVDEIKKAEDDAAEATALARVDEAIAQEITDIRDPAVSQGVLQQSASSVNIESVTKETSTGTERSLSVTPVEIASPSSNVTTATSIHDAESQALSAYITKLHEQQSYSQIPPAFESLVVQGLKPTVEDYNALLASVTHLSIAKHQVVPKALDIFSDMLQRKVDPDTSFYSSLIEVLAYRALDVVHMKKILEQKRLRCGGRRGKAKFLFSSNEADYDILLQDHAILNAVKIFQTSTSLDEARRFSSETYRALVTACALHGRIDDMISVYTHMESHRVQPVASMFPPMIKAFATSGDLSSAVESYNEYKSLAIAADAGRRAILGRNDNEVYSALVKAYTLCGKHDGAHRFFGRIVESFASVTDQRKERLEAVQDSVTLDALIEDRLSFADFLGALRIAEERNLSPLARARAMAMICTTCADHDNYDVAIKAYQYLSHGSAEKSSAALSMLALHTRQGKLDAAGVIWAHLDNFDHSLIEPATSYIIALLRNGNVVGAMIHFRETFARIRAVAGVGTLRTELSEEIDEAIEYVGAFLVENNITLPPNASMNLLWAMVENGGLVTPVAEHVLSRLDPKAASSLGWQDIILALQVEAGLLTDSEAPRDAIHLPRFAYFLELAVSSSIRIDNRTTNLVEKALSRLSLNRSDLVNKWHTHQKVSSESPRSQPTSTISSAVPFNDSYDPYAANTDYKGSSFIAEELEHRRNNAGLNEALMRFRNIRRAARHPRYIAYAKLISAAAKEGRTNLIHDILGMARTDVPYLPQYPVVRHGWSTILDSMVGACLTLGRRTLAGQFHQEMLDMGTAPTANTFGLYITTLKDSTKTFDEASEAVAIFSRALSEGVSPSSFLYNALIGKLGKARRIDDCLRYFQEMRAAGIRPTSVTYGTVVNALCRVSDDRFAEELFDEMESVPDYKPRPAPYNSLMQFFLTTKRDSQKVLAYYDRMRSKGIQPTMHTYKLLIDTYATLEPTNLAAAEAVLNTIRASGQRPEAVHFASLIHARGCALHDMDGARRIFADVLANGEIQPQACLYQALFESMVANHCVTQTDDVLERMSTDGVEMTPYIANTLIHGWATADNISKSKAIYDAIGIEKREPSTYEAMTRAFLIAQDRDGALSSVHEMLSRGYPAAVSSKILELVGHGMNRSGNVVLSELIV